MKLSIHSLRGLAPLCAVLSVMTFGTAFAQDVLPNLEPFPASDIELTDGGNTLRFSTTSWNRGAAPMELVGGEVIENGTPDSPGSRVVYQRIFSADGTSRLVDVGTFEYHGDNHNHFHFEDYARYTLQPLNAPGGSERTSTKVSFCLLDNVKVNTRLPNAPKKPFYETCNPFVQGISVGWGDLYANFLEGQSFDFSGNPSGDYLLKIEVNPLRNLSESSYNDNVSCAVLRVDASALSVQVIGTSCSPPPAPPTITSIAPNSIRAGSQSTVTISGSDFYNGIDVSFVNGSGKIPAASNVVVVNSSTITATVSVASGGSPSDPVWDLQVGGAVLANAFTVIR